MRAQTLSAVKAGITRLREKGGASASSLFDLVNGFVTANGTIQSRGGTEIDNTASLAGTKGLVLFRGKFVVFADHVVAMADPDYRVEVLRHPDPAQAEATLVDVRYAQPFLGYLYVVAKWSNGDFIHYWLQELTAWTASTMYQVGQIVGPTTPNGFAYRATRVGPPAPVWQAGVARILGDVVEPTVFNGFKHTVVEVAGANPRSGDTEPEWARVDDGLTFEDADNPTPSTPVTPTDPPVTPPRYGSGGGNGDPFNTVIQ